MDYPSDVDVKKKLRAEFRRDREQRFMPESWTHILGTTEIAQAEWIATYISYGYEPETSDLNQAAIASGKKLLLPRLLPDNDLEWVPWDGAMTSLKKVKNFLEPVGKKIQDESVIEIVITPALRIDRSGVRLGQGGGSYDRALSRLRNGGRQKIWAIGLVHAGELTSETLPHEPHDQKLDAAATPNLVTRFII